MRRSEPRCIPSSSPAEYGCGKARRTAARARIDKMGLMVDVDGEGEMDKVKLEDAVLAICSCEAVYALSAIEDQPVIETAINGPESAKWKCALEEELA